MDSLHGQNSAVVPSPVEAVLNQGQGRVPIPLRKMAERRVLVLRQNPINVIPPDVLVKFHIQVRYI